MIYYIGAILLILIGIIKASTYKEKFN